MQACVRFLSVCASTSLAVRLRAVDEPNVDVNETVDVNEMVNVNESLAKRNGVYAWMTQLNGTGFCENGYVAGWDGLYLNETECVEHCRTDPECKAVSFVAPGVVEAIGWFGTCSRYNEVCTEEDLNNTGDAGPFHSSFSKHSTKYVDYDGEYMVREETLKSQERVMAHLQDTLPDGGKVALISMLGSFAPLTKGHLNAFVQSRKVLLERGFDEVLGVMSFNPEGHVKAKLKRKKMPNVPFNKRHELAECAFQDIAAPWMTTEFQQTLFHRAIQKNPKFVNYTIQLFFANGADDVFLGRKYEQCGKSFPDNRMFIMVGRPGDTDAVQKLLEQRGISGNDTECLWIDNENSFSSSQLRKAAMAKEVAKVHEIADGCVAEFMNGPFVEVAIKEKEEAEAKLAAEAEAAAKATETAANATVAAATTAANATEPTNR